LNILLVGSILPADIDIESSKVLGDEGTDDFLEDVIETDGSPVFRL
jgi:hypothetical protein